VCVCVCVCVCVHARAHMYHYNSSFTCQIYWHKILWCNCVL